ncbi:MAG: rhomboid family intramembrane serine protease [Planctomycetales bacterium]|nr:rhomboid family intramembrane serine protease [Planctomycetales bacterium]
MPRRVVSGGALWQLLTSQFLHDPVWPWHILGNLWTLWVFGPALERTWGKWRFLRFYLLCGIGAGVTQVAAAYLPRQSPDVPVIGASGALFGLLAGYALWFPRERLVLFPFPMALPARVVALLYGALTIALAASASGESRIAHWAHLGGLVAGWFLLSCRVGAVRLWGDLLWRLRVRKVRVAPASRRHGPVLPP